MLEAETIREQWPEAIASAPETTPVKVKKLGHVVFTVSDIERTTKFWTEIMDFRFLTATSMSWSLRQETGL